MKSKKNKIKLRLGLPKGVLSNQSITKSEVDKNKKLKLELLQKLNEQLKLENDKLKEKRVKRIHPDWKIAYLSNCIAIARVSNGIESPFEYKIIRHVQDRLMISTAQIGESIINSIEANVELYEFSNEMTISNCFEDMILVAMADGSVCENELELISDYGLLAGFDEIKIMTAWNSAKERLVKLLSAQQADASDLVTNAIFAPAPTRKK